MKFEHWFAGMFLVASSAALLWWVGLVGDLTGGSLNAFALVLFIIIPLAGVWLLTFAFHRAKVSKPWFLYVQILATVFVIPAYLQPWGVRAHFMSDLNSLPGKTVREAQKQMRPYPGGELSPLGQIYVPDDLEGRGVTHVLVYQWDKDSRLSRGHVFVGKGRVIGVKFIVD